MAVSEGELHTVSEGELNTPAEVIENNRNAASGLNKAPASNQRTTTTIRVGSYRRISFDDKTVKRHNRRMNRISSLRHRQRQRHTDSLSAAESADRNQCAVDHNEMADCEENNSGVVISEVLVREYKKTSESTVSSGNHSSVFSNSSRDDTTPVRKQKDMVRGGYSPNKSTLGLELVASPSLLKQVLSPSESLMTGAPLPSGGSVGGSTLSSTRSFHKEMERAKSFDRSTDDPTRRIGETGEEEEGSDDSESEASSKEDEIFDDESSYSAMPTVAAQTVITATSSVRGKRDISESSIQEEEMAASLVAAAALAATPTAIQNEINKPLSLRPTYSMRSVESSEGMEVGQFLNATEPFDESDAKIIASSKATAAAVAATTTSTSSPQTKIPSCLRPSSFSSDQKQQQQQLVSPALLQSRVHKSTRIARFRSTFDKKCTSFESPTSVNEFFPDVAVADPTTPQDDGSIASSATGSSIERNSSITNRLARNRQALKSIAAKGSAKDARRKKTVEKEKGTTKAVSPTEQEEIAVPSTAQSVSELDTPQFRPESHGVNAENCKANEARLTEKSEANPIDSSREDEVDESNQSIEVDASVLLNTSDESINTKKKRFLLPRLRRKSREGSTSTPKSSNKSSTKEKGSTSKQSIRSKLFGSKKKEEATAKSAEELEQIREVEKYTAWLAPTTQPSDETFSIDEAPTPIKSEPTQEKEDVKLSRSGGSEHVFEKRAANPIPSKDRTQSLPVDAGVGAAAILAVASTESTDDFPSDAAASPSFSMCEGTQAAKNNTLPFFGLRARSSSSKNSKSSSHSKLSMSPNGISSEPDAAESSFSVRSGDVDDDAPFLVGNDTNAASSSGGSQSASGDFVDFGAASTRNEGSESALETSTEVNNSSFENEIANTKVQQMFPELGSPQFVGGDVSGEVEHGVEVEWGVSVMDKNEFGDQGITLDTTAVVAELNRSLSEAKWDNNTKVGDDISWPSEIASQQESPVTTTLSTPLEANDSSPSSTENKFSGIEEASAKSGGTKSSSLHPRKLFRRRDKDRRDRHKLEEEDEHESVSNFKRCIEKKRSPHPAEKRMRGYNTRRGKNDSHSVDEDSDNYSSDDYSSDGREDVVGVIATTIHNGFTGIVDMMEDAFAFNKDDEETIDYGSESYESESEDEDSYIQRKIARRRDKQRRILHEARRSSRRKEYERKIQRRSKSSRHQRTPDNDSNNSEEDPSRTKQQAKA